MTMIAGVPAYKCFIRTSEGRAYFELPRPIIRNENGVKKTIIADDYSKTALKDLITELGTAPRGETPEDKSVRDALIQVLQKGYEALGSAEASLGFNENAAATTTPRATRKTVIAAGKKPQRRNSRGRAPV